MDTLGVDDDHIVTTAVDLPMDPDDVDGPTLLYNRTNLQMIEDGVDRITIQARADGDYDVYVWGCWGGAFRTTLAGAEQIGARAPTGDATVPQWTVEHGTVDTDDRPAWLDEDVTLRPRVDCSECGATVGATNIYTPGTTGGPDPEEFVCEDCWDALRPEQR